MNDSKYQDDIDATASQNNNIMKSAKGMGHFKKKNWFLFDIWFYSKRYSEAIEDIVAYFIALVKTITKVYHKEK